MPASNKNNTKTQASGVSASRTVDTDAESTTAGNQSEPLPVQRASCRIRLMGPNNARNYRRASARAAQNSGAPIGAVGVIGSPSPTPPQSGLIRYRDTERARAKKLDELQKKIAALRETMMENCVELIKAYEQHVKNKENGVRSEVPWPLLSQANLEAPVAPVEPTVSVEHVETVQPAGAQAPAAKPVSGKGKNARKNARGE